MGYQNFIQGFLSCEVLFSPHKCFTSPYVFCSYLCLMLSKCEMSFKCELFVQPRQLGGMEDEEFIKINTVNAQRGMELQLY
jgi:hypothetical protein